MFSITAIACGPPKPRKAVFDGRFVKQHLAGELDVRQVVAVVGVEQRALHDGEREVGRAAAVGVELEREGAGCGRRRRSRLPSRLRYGCRLPVTRMSSSLL